MSGQFTPQQRPFGSDCHRATGQPRLRARSEHSAPVPVKPSSQLVPGLAGAPESSPHPKQLRIKAHPIAPATERKRRIVRIMSSDPADSFLWKLISQTAL
ncbi:MAG TPA: hypothetical protein VGB99_06975, partial [Acidobacteriota bacterium]